MNAIIELAAFFLTVFMVSRLFKKTAHIKKAIYLLAFFGFALSLFGIIQQFTYDGKMTG